MKVDIKGAEGLALVGKAVRRLGSDRVIVKNMTKEIKAAIVPPVRAAARRNALSYLPRRGGLGAWVAKARITASVRRGASTAGVTISGGRNSSGARSDLKRIDAGSTRHPTFGHSPWQPQSLRPGFFGDAVNEQGAEALQEAVIRAVDNAAREVLGG
jgi:hypothetical protein